jgi:hypothetical protein
MLKEMMLSQKAAAQARHDHLDTREGLLDQQLVLTNQRDADSQQMVTDAKELYAIAEALTNTLIRQEEDLITRVRPVDEQAHAVKELEEWLLERDELDDHNLSHELECLGTRESSLNHREAALETERRPWRMPVSWSSLASSPPRSRKPT